MNSWQEIALAALGTCAVSLLVSTCTGALLSFVAGASPRLGRPLFLRSVELVGVVPTLLVVVGAGHAAALPHTVSLGALLGIAQGVRLARVLRTELIKLEGSLELVAARALGITRTRLARDHLWPHLVPHLALNLAITPAVIVGAQAALALLDVHDFSTSSWGRLLVEPGPWRAAALLALVGTTALLFLAGRTQERAQNHGA